MAKDDFYFLYDLIKDQAHDARNQRSYDYERIIRRLVDTVRSLRDRAEDDLREYRDSIKSQDLPEYRKQLKLAEKELALYSSLMDKTKASRKQSEVQYQDAKKQTHKKKQRSRSRSEW